MIHRVDVKPIWRSDGIQVAASSAVAESLSDIWDTLQLAVKQWKDSVQKYIHSWQDRPKTVLFLSPADYFKFTGQHRHLATVKLFPKTGVAVVVPQVLCVFSDSQEDYLDQIQTALLRGLTYFAFPKIRSSEDNIFLAGLAMLLSQSRSQVELTIAAQSRTWLPFISDFVGNFSLRGYYPHVVGLSWVAFLVDSYGLEKVACCFNERSSVYLRKQVIQEHGTEYHLIENWNRWVRDIESRCEEVALRRETDRCNIFFRYAIGAPLEVDAWQAGNDNKREEDIVYGCYNFLYHIRRRQFLSALEIADRLLGIAPKRLLPRLHLGYGIAADAVGNRRLALMHYSLAEELDIYAVANITKSLTNNGKLANYLLKKYHYDIQKIILNTDYYIAILLLRLEMMGRTYEVIRLLPLL